MLLALEFVTEGSHAEVPERLSDEVFTTESFVHEAVAVQRKSKSWTQGRGIQGVGIGDKLSNGKPTAELALRVYVEKKKPASRVSNLVPKRVHIPELGPCQTDVLEIGRVTRRWRIGDSRP